ncbi:MAG: glucosaminidase domain-containing protein, partial [Ethanoligenens sp.]
NAGYANINHSGYTLLVDTTQLSSGTYTLAVAGIGNNGVVQWATKSIYVATPNPLTTIDAPSNGANVTGTINVSGWALNASGIDRVDIYAYDSNGQAHSLGSVASKDLTSRTDVAQVFANAGYANINHSGYTLSVDTTQLSSGTYTLAVAGIGNNSVVQWATEAITITGSVTITSKPFNTTLDLLAQYNHVTADSINPTTLFADEQSKYEFISLYGLSGVTASDINTMLTNCGVLTGQGQAVVDAASTYNINPVYLAAHLRLESGNGTSKLAVGIQVAAGTYTDSKGKTVTVSTTGTYYNLLGIHAYDGNAVPDGSQYAASQNWNSIQAAIVGGAAWVSKNYIHNSQMGSAYYDQPTLYEMKWDPQGTVKHNAQGQSEYATDPDWAYNIASTMAQYSNIFVGKNITYYVAKFNS